MMFYVSIVISLLFVLSLQAWSFIPGVIAVILFFFKQQTLDQPNSPPRPLFSRAELFQDANTHPHTTPQPDEMW